MIGSPGEWARDFAFWLLDQRKTRGYHLMNDLRFGGTGSVRRRGVRRGGQRRTNRRPIPAVLSGRSN